MEEERGMTADTFVCLARQQQGEQAVCGWGWVSISILWAPCRHLADTTDVPWKCTSDVQGSFNQRLHSLQVS